ncbi:MAG: hypothetical protein MUO84_01050, partial [Thermoplasmata archaeon]|nr:hypothetical protein [Thermoplasmata archaeon]
MKIDTTPLADYATNPARQVLQIKSSLGQTHLGRPHPDRTFDIDCLSQCIDVREITKPISSPIRNAYIDFSKMTTSLVAVVTDAVRDGRPVVGYGFNS